MKWGLRNIKINANSIIMKTDVDTSSQRRYFLKNFLFYINTAPSTEQCYVFGGIKKSLIVYKPQLLYDWFYQQRWDYIRMSSNPRNVSIWYSLLNRKGFHDNKCVYLYLYITLQPNRFPWVGTNTIYINGRNVFYVTGRISYNPAIWELTDTRQNKQTKTI